MQSKVKTLISRSVVIWGFILLLLMIPACTRDSSQGKIIVVTTNNIIADWAMHVGGEKVEVHSLLAAGVDPHTFQPGAGDVAVVAKARVIFTIGLGLEGAWLNRLLENAAASPDRVKTLGDQVNPLAAPEEKQGIPAEDQARIFDPHFWWDPLKAKIAVDEIAHQLIIVDPDNTGIYTQNSDIYTDELNKLDTRIKQNIMQIPTERRKIVTSHETMQYFAVHYGFEAVGSIFAGVTTEKEPSPAELSTLTKNIESLGVPAIFTETTVNDRLARAIATETGVRIVRLYSDSLGLPGSGADTYIAMMDTDIKLIVDALE